MARGTFLSPTNGMLALAIYNSALTAFVSTTYFFVLVALSGNGGWLCCLFVYGVVIFVGSSLFGHLGHDMLWFCDTRSGYIRPRQLVSLSLQHCTRCE